MTIERIRSAALVMLRRMRRLSCLFLAFSLLAVVLPSCKKTQTPSGPRACTADSDCVIACESRTSCCNSPYCEGAQHGEDAREIREENTKRCTAKDRADCPVVGARAEVDYRVVPKCKASACVAEKTPK
jgi:hypothetical protein